MTFEQAIKQAIIQYLEGHNLDEYTKVVGSKKRKYNKLSFLFQVKREGNRPLRGIKTKNIHLTFL